MARNTNQEPNEERASTEQPQAAQEQDAPERQAQSVVDQETRQGFRGVEVDPTPNEAYTVQGVISGQPTPETDRATRDAVRVRVQQLADDVASGGPSAQQGGQQS